MSKEFRKKSTLELQKLVEEKRKTLQDFRFGVVGAKRKNVKEGATVRREIAEVLTIIREREPDRGRPRH